MSFSPVRLMHILAAAAVLAACGRSEPVQPVAAPDVTAPEPAAEAHEATEDHAEDHDHAHDESAAGGEAHVHGLAELAITREGNKVLGELISPMANFGLSESEGTYTDVVIAELSGLVEVEGGDCVAAVPHPMTDNSGPHTDGIVHFVWTCAKPDDVRLVRFAGFAAFPSFETVRVIYITDAGQTAGDLTASAPELSLK